MKVYLDYYSQPIVDNDYFHIDINWFSSWLFLIPSYIEFVNGYFPRIFYFILIPSLINHAHIKKYDHIINPIEKVFIYLTGLVSVIERTLLIILNGFSIYDLILYPSGFMIVYIYNIANLSNGHKYACLYHLIVHILGTIIGVVGYKVYDL